MKKLLMAAAASCCLTMMSFMTSCTNMIDNPVMPVSAVDDGEWQVTDEMMDKSVRPGDDFFMYCNGGFWQSATIDESKPDITSWLYKEVPEKMNELVGALRLPSSEKLKADLARIDADAIDHMNARLQSAVDRIDALTTKEEAWDLIGDLMLEGYMVPIWLDLFSVEGRTRVMAGIGMPNDYSAIVKPKDKDLAWLLLKNPDVLACARPLTTSASRGYDQEAWPMLTAIFNKLGIALEDAYTIDEVPDYPNEYVEYFTQLNAEAQAYEVDQWKEILTDVVTYDANIYDDEYLQMTNEQDSTSFTHEEMVNNLANHKLMYEKSKAFADTYVTPAMKQQCLAACEELRETFRKRIENNEWMSPASKQNVREKLDAMLLNVAYPDEWFSEGLPDISQEETLLDDVMALRRNELNFVRRLIGMPTSRAGFHHLIGLMCDLTTINAFYMPNHNSMNILPVWLMEPFTDPNANDAHNYATYSVYGHEITHGFDTDGSRFNKDGDLADLWGSEADHQEFLRRAQQLADNYSKMEVMPWALPGLYSDGAFTLGENIADLGGFLIAYDTYQRHLRESGFSGEQLELQRQRYYMAIGWLWHAKYSAQFAQIRTQGSPDSPDEKDVHSLFRERVNGMVMNTDDWYELFPVSPSDELYLAPEDRVKIW